MAEALVIFTRSGMPERRGRGPLARYGRRRDQTARPNGVITRTAALAVRNARLGQQGARVEVRPTLHVSGSDAAELGPHFGRPIRDSCGQEDAQGEETHEDGPFDSAWNHSRAAAGQSHSDLSRAPRADIRSRDPQSATLLGPQHKRVTVLFKTEVHLGTGRRTRNPECAGGVQQRKGAPSRSERRG